MPSDAATTMLLHSAASNSVGFILLLLACCCPSLNAEERDTQCDRRCRCHTPLQPSCLHHTHAAEMSLARIRTPISLELGCCLWTSAIATPPSVAPSVVAPVPNLVSYLNGHWPACVVATASPTTRQPTLVSVAHFRYMEDSAGLAAHATTSTYTTQPATT